MNSEGKLSDLIKEHEANNKKSRRSSKRKMTSDDAPVVPIKKMNLESKERVGPAASLNDIPHMILAQITSHLPLNDMYNFWLTSNATAKAVDHHWISQRTLSLTPSSILHYFPLLDRGSLAMNSMFLMRHQIGELISYFPLHRINAFDASGLSIFSWKLFIEMMESLNLDPFALLSCVRLVNLDKCIVSSEDIKNMAQVMCGVRHIIISANTFHLYPEHRPADPTCLPPLLNHKDLLRLKRLPSSRSSSISFLRSSFPSLRKVTITDALPQSL